MHFCGNLKPIKKYDIIYSKDEISKDLNSESYTQKFINRARGIAKGIKVGGISNTLISFPSCQCACLHTSTTNIIYHNWHIDNHTKKLADSHVKSKKYTVQKAIKGSEGNVILSRNEILTLCTILDMFSTLQLSNSFKSI